MAERQACYLYSKANYPIRIRYNGEDLMLPSNATKVLIEDESKLGVLPAKVRKITIKEEK